MCICNFSPIFILHFFHISSLVLSCFFPKLKTALLAGVFFIQIKNLNNIHNIFIIFCITFFHKLHSLFLSSVSEDIFFLIYKTSLFKYCAVYYIFLLFFYAFLCIFPFIWRLSLLKVILTILIKSKT